MIWIIDGFIWIVNAKKSVIDFVRKIKKFYWTSQVTLVILLPVLSSFWYHCSRWSTMNNWQKCIEPYFLPELLPDVLGLSSDSVDLSCAVVIESQPRCHKTTVPQMILWIVLYLPLRWELDKSKEFNKLNKSLGYRINASSPSNSNVPSSDRPPCFSVIPSQPTIHSATFFKTPFKSSTKYTERLIYLLEFKSSTKYTERLIYLLEFREKNIKQHKHWLYKIQNKLPHLKTTGQFKDLKITAHYS